MKLVDDIRFYLSCLNYWQQQQEAAVLLREAATALEEMQRDSERLSNAERDAFGGQSLDAAACAAGGRMSEWIPVSERLPDHTNTVIVSDEHGVWFANRENKLAGWWDTCGGGMMENVTHWMPLPEPPCCPEQATPLGNTTPD